MVSIKPLDDRVVIEPIEAEEKTQGGILLPDTAKEKPMRGKIVAVGEGRMLENGKRAELLVKKGDKVLYGKYAGTEVVVDGKEYLVMRESDILAKIE
ncbi:MAG: co-chaperone GroES [Candidatus Jettenia sp.]|uniref:Co-chaperonin GroES n=1 Tax=Candidatus Jettenia caeni TaxID=247490 RepID=I3IHA7_9BACT|nr:co-chaperone GroES [Candidatus Jettenia sp. AMX1]MBC6929215.1 co-chaperone GroES [Candidatus Jettenia sp.]NUN23778.1 co-chaperone GroES [Candidatus Jettenia caeni]KAA0250171.1 MAG: co-chaperone GroES [Candidatus Jettenia sp. AMX1]MCE7880552.1 co-chaperone GroES [Candidatus Jettenia sp. AMX1]MCQ3927353.1 co-chaperone GroES [Candidatus Jettenia sp.]